MRQGKKISRSNVYFALLEGEAGGMTVLEIVEALHGGLQAGEVKPSDKTNVHAIGTERAEEGILLN